MDNNVETINNASGRPGGNNADVIDLVEIFYLLLGHFWQIVLSLILGAVAAFLYTYFMVTPLYTASSQIYIVSASNNSVVNLSDLQVGSQLTADYQDLMLSRPLLQDVIDNLSLNMSHQQLASMVNISNKNDTRILKVSVTSSDPAQAAAISNELSKQAIEYLPDIMECEQPNLVENAEVPTQKVSPSYRKNTMMGGLALCALYCGILLLRYLMNDTFMTPDDVERYFGVRPLATIPEGNLDGKTKKKKKKSLLTYFMKSQ